MERIELRIGDWWQGSEILWERMDSLRETTKPKKFFPESESWKWRMSSGLDSLDGDLEKIGRRDNGGLLGLRNGG